jgi:RNA polymerase sigma-70 factor (ECF subfamily)
MTIGEYNRCVDNCADSLYRFILKNLKDKDAAQDIVQESFLRLWEKRRELSDDKSKPYLFTTAYHLLIDNIRHAKRFLTIEYAENTFFEENHHNFDVQKVLHQAMTFLPDEQKTVLLLRDYEGFSYKEIEEITGLNESQVKVYIYRARLFLKKYIGRMEAVI